MTKKVIIVVNEDLFFLTHRKNLGLFLIKNGWDVFVMAAKTSDMNRVKIESLGFTFIELPIERSDVNLFKELKTLKFLYRAFKKVKPSLIMNVGLKPILLGGISAKFVRIPTISAVSGLGFLFTEGKGQRSWKQYVLVNVLRYMLPPKKHHIIFQNEEDRDIFLKNKIINYSNTSIIPGMGVDMSEYQQSPFEEKEGEIQFLFPARMLKDKGLMEFIKAAKRVGKKFSNARFVLAGNIDLKNPTGLSEEGLQKMIEGAEVKWIGYQEDMVPVYKQSDIVVLPSYREGFPKVLIEACAIGRPIITTDVPGCRDCVENEINGFLVPAKSVIPLLNAMSEFLERPKLIESMGEKSSQLAREKFDCYAINKQFLQIFEQIIK